MKKGLLIVLLIAINCFISNAQSNKIPLDNNVIVGKLENGLTYYIKRNTKPEGKVELRLIVNAGSILEKEEQQGVAHFLEHMAFNGTTNFPKNELLNYLQKSGVRFGADLNASTSFDYTMYMLPISTTDETVLQNGYKVIRDWAGNLMLEPAEIDKERGIILEEKRMRQNAFMRTITQYYPIMLNNSLYSQRIPIGKEDIIKTAPKKAFADFYTDWYRPNNMAVIAVGDIDVVKTEATIKKLFSDLKKPSQYPERPAIIPIKWHDTNKAEIVSDAENVNNTLAIYFDLKKSTAATTWDAYGEEELQTVITDLFDGRLEEYSLDPKSPIGGGGISLQGSFFRGYEIGSLNAVIKNSPVAAINLIMAELLKAKQYGFTQQELDRVKKNIENRYNRYLAEKDKTESASYAAEYMQHFLENEPMPGIEEEHKFMMNFLHSLTLEKVNATIKTFNLNSPAFILYNATEAQKNIVSTEALIAAYENSKLQKVEPYIEKNISYELMDEQPKAGKIIATENNDILNSTTLTLSNGINVIYKKSDFKNDEIIFKGSQWGGLTNLSAEEIKSATYLSVVSSLGLGNHTGSDMPKVLSGVQAGVNTFAGPTQFSLFGSSTINDFEKLLQMIYLKFTKVNFDANEFEGIKETYAAQLGGIAKNPMAKFNDTLNKFRYNYTNRITKLPSTEELKSLQLNELANTYKKLTKNLNGATFVFTGNIDENVFRNYIEKYIASIPTEPTIESINKSNLVKPINGKNVFTFKAGKENKSQISYSYYGETAEVSEKDILAFSLMGDILQIKTTDKLREEMGSTYSPSVNAGFTRPPLGAFNLLLSVSAAPENVEKITAAYDALIVSMINGSVSDDDMIKAKSQRIKVFETQSKTNGYWSNMLELQHVYHIDSKNITTYINRVEAISKEDIIAVAKKYLTDSNTLKGIMNPE